MKNIYNKGKYRSGEWCKHLRPFLKRAGNKKWRKDVGDHIQKETEEWQTAVLGKFSKTKRVKPVRIKITLSNGGFTYSRYRQYESLEQAEQSIRRNNVIRVYRFNKKMEIIKSRH